MILLTAVEPSLQRSNVTFSKDAGVLRTSIILRMLCISRLSTKHLFNANNPSVIELADVSSHKGLDYG